ncbi:MAG: hypothetical protein IAG10_16555 [Planctomycetaceae bacterium]|nr:hypothetical protein [Planctomycetaceae bacterium]
MADQVTPDKSPEAIELEMLQTRESLTEKVAALESQVAGTVQSAADTISSTVEAVKSLVSNAPEAMSDGVKQATDAVRDAMTETFDISGHVRRHPWAAVGSSALLGVVVAWLTTRGRSEVGAPTPFASPTAVPPAFQPVAAKAPGLMDEFMEMIGEKLKDLGRTALETVSASVKDNIQTAVPKGIDEAVSALTNHGSDAAATEPFAHRFGGRHARS